MITKKEKKLYSITLNVTVEIEKAQNGKRIPWFSFKGWKGGIISKATRFIDTEEMQKMTRGNMEYLGESIFQAAREMYDEDESK